jgi:hypothetical protein
LCYGDVMSERLSEEELNSIRKRVVELKTEHRDLDAAIDSLIETGKFEELRIKRMKRRKLQLKDDIARLENTLIPDILA